MVVKVRGRGQGFNAQSARQAPITSIGVDEVTSPLKKQPPKQQPQQPPQPPRQPPQQPRQPPQQQPHQPEPQESEPWQPPPPPPRPRQQCPHQEEPQEPVPQHQAQSHGDQSSAASACNNRKRGRTKCISVDMKTKNGKLSIVIPPEIDRAIGENAREIVTYCGWVVRNTAPVTAKNWNEVAQQVGENMRRKVQEKFYVKDDEIRLQRFVLETMSRLFKNWRHRLHMVYKRCKNDEDELQKVPDDVTKDDWNYLINYWKSKEFLKKSKTNSDNRAKLITKHTCGSKSFAEVEDKMRDPTTGKKKNTDDVWLAQHTKRTKEGELVWSDPKSKEVYHQLQDLVAQQPEEESNQMTFDEMLLQVLGPKSGYFRGKGAGKKPPSYKGFYATHIADQQKK